MDKKSFPEDEELMMAEETKAAPAAEPETDPEENSFYVSFRKPFLFEGETYNGVDLSGLEDLSARDMIQTQRTMERAGTVSVLPEMSLEYACYFAAKATGKPVEFFQALPPREAIKIKNRVTRFFYSED